MRKLSILLTLLFLLANGVSAHDGTLPAQSFSSFGSIEIIHFEPENGQTDNDFKGWAMVTVTNSMNESWGDFHFQISSWASQPSVFFPETVAPVMSWPAYTYSYSNYNAAGAQQLNFDFKANPVLPGQMVTFQVYTDNTTNRNAWFGLNMYPTPVPEPATIAILGIGGVLVLLRKRRP